MSLFTFDEAGARAHIADRIAEDEAPSIWAESPARSLEELVHELTDYIAAPDGLTLLIYPLIYEADPDGVLIVVGRPHPAPYLAASPMDWDDIIDRQYAPDCRLDEWYRDLSADAAVEIVTTVLLYANDLLDREAEMLGRAVAAGAAVSR